MYSIYTYIYIYPSIIVSSYLVVSFPSSAPTIRLCPSSPSFPEFSQLCCQHPRYNEKKCGCDSAMIEWNPPNGYDKKCCHHSNRPISMIKKKTIHINFPYPLIYSILIPYNIHHVFMDFLLDFLWSYPHRNFLISPCPRELPWPGSNP